MLAHELNIIAIPANREHCQDIYGTFLTAPIGPYHNVLCGTLLGCSDHVHVATF